MSTISEAIGFNLIVIGPTLALVATALVLLFCTITIETSDFVKKTITFGGILLTIFTVFLKFGLFLTDGISSYFTEKILIDEFSLFGNVLIALILLFNFSPIWNTSNQLKDKTTEAIILALMSASGNQVCSNICADLPIAPINKSKQIRSIALTSKPKKDKFLSTTVGIC